MAKIAVIGLYSNDNGVADGQSIKTNIVVEELERIYGRADVLRINTYGWKKHPFRLFMKSIAAVRKCSNVIFMTDAGGIKVFPWLLYLANIAGKCRLHYVVVGGWLLHFPEEHRILSAFLKRFDCIYVETNVMKRGLEAHGFKNIILMPNFKRLPILPEDELQHSDQEPYRLCTFSRVMREKGVGDAAQVVRDVNVRLGRRAFELDIYGAVDTEQVEWFEKLSAGFPDEVRYCGIVPYSRSVEVLKAYHALLFPTRFYTEGVPGTIIDAFAAGVPVISSEWESCADIIEPGRTGITYPFEDNGALTDILIGIADDPDVLRRMKKNCLAEAMKYMPEQVINILVNRLA